MYNKGERAKPIMKTKKGKWPAILLALAMVLTMSPYMAFAADTSDAAEGPGACKLTEGCSLPVVNRTSKTGQ